MAEQEITRALPRKTIESKGIDRKGSFLWLTRDRFSARSEAIIQAAQDWGLTF